MKNSNNEAKGNVRSALRKCYVNGLIVKPIVSEIRRQRRSSLKLARRIFDKVKEIDESIEIVARGIKRQSERNR